jgi:hypothetical protein
MEKRLKQGNKGGLVHAGWLKKMATRRAPKSESPSSDPSTSSPVPSIDSVKIRTNYISKGMGYTKSLFQPASDRWATLNTTQRYVAALIAAPLIVVPAVWVLFVLPPFAILFAIIYSLIFGFSTFVAHLEDGLRQHLSVSDEVTTN